MWKLWQNSNGGRAGRLRYGNGEYVKVCQERIKQKSSKNHPNKMIFGTFGPSVEIRTQGLLNPIQARYQTSPHPDAVSNSLVIIPWGEEKSKRVLKKRGKYMHNLFAVFRDKIGRFIQCWGRSPLQAQFATKFPDGQIPH